MRLSENYVYRNIYDMALLIPITKYAKTRNLISLNKTAAELIESLPDCSTVEELANKVLNGYIDAEKYRENLLLYIQNLINNEIICKE